MSLSTIGRVKQVFDFTGTLSGKESLNFPVTVLGAFDKTAIKNIRAQAGDGNTIVVIDKGIGFNGKEPFLVADHLNLTGSNPLIGPNDDCGPRFPGLNSVYVLPAELKLNSMIVAGLKHGVEPNAAERDFLSGIKAQAWSYNLVPAVIIAAHAGLKVVGILLPSDTKAEQLTELLQALK
jgi:purine-nucleoside phosphorylase